MSDMSITVMYHSMSLTVLYQKMKIKVPKVMVDIF